MKVTFKELLKSIKDTCLSHKQVKAYDYGDFYKKMKGNTYNYPLCFLTDTESQIVGSEASLNFAFFVMDKLLSDGSNEETVLSDCLSIGLDIVGELQYCGEDKWFLDYSVVKMKSFTDNLSDVVGGWTFYFTIKINEAYNTCDAPFVRPV